MSERTTNLETIPSVSCILLTLLLDMLIVPFSSLRRRIIGLPERGQAERLLRDTRQQDAVNR